LKASFSLETGNKLKEGTTTPDTVSAKNNFGDSDCKGSRRRSDIVSLYISMAENWMEVKIPSSPRSFLNKYSTDR